MRRLCILPLAVVACASLALPASAAAAELPPQGTAKFHWKRANCVQTDVGYRSVGIIKTEVRQFPASDGDEFSRYYQKVTIQIDREVLGGMWRKVDQRKYDWSRFTSATTKLPTWSTSGIRTGLMDETHTLTAKATVKLKRERRGPDKTVWEYAVRSVPFECINPNEGNWLSKAAAAQDAEGEARCHYKSAGRHIRVGLMAYPFDTVGLEDPSGSGPFAYYEVAIKLREKYGRKWKSFPLKYVRLPKFDVWTPPTSYGGRSFYYGSRLYTKKAFASLGRLKGTAKLTLKDADTGAVYGTTEKVKFSWVKNSPTGACMLEAAPQLPLVN